MVIVCTPGIMVMGLPGYLDGCILLFFELEDEWSVHQHMELRSRMDTSDETFRNQKPRDLPDLSSTDTDRC